MFEKPTLSMVRSRSSVRGAKCHSETSDKFICIYAALCSKGRPDFVAEVGPALARAAAVQRHGEPVTGIDTCMQAREQAREIANYLACMNA